MPPSADRRAAGAWHCRGLAVNARLTRSKPGRGPSVRTKGCPARAVAASRLCSPAPFCSCYWSTICSCDPPQREVAAGRGADARGRRRAGERAGADRRGGRRRRRLHQLHAGRRGLRAQLSVAQPAARRARRHALHAEAAAVRQTLRANMLDALARGPQESRSPTVQSSSAC